MKNNDLLLYGALVVGAYILLKKKAPVATTPIAYLPTNTNYSPVPVTTPANTIAQISTGISSLLTNLFNQPSTPAPVQQVAANSPTQAAQSTIDDIFSTPSLPSYTPVTSIYNNPNQLTALQAMFSNNDIMAGMALEEWEN